MAPHSSTLAWKIPWTEEPGGLQSMGSLRVGHDWATSLSLFTFRHWRKKWQHTPVFLPGESQGRWTWWAAVDGVAQSQTRLKWLSSSSMPLTCVLRCARRLPPPLSLSAKMFFFFSEFWILNDQNKEVAGNLNYITWMGCKDYLAWGASCTIK